VVIPALETAGVSTVGMIAAGLKRHFFVDSRE
jgi:hypothetical protein